MVIWLHKGRGMRVPMACGDEVRKEYIKLAFAIVAMWSCSCSRHSNSRIIVETSGGCEL
jgi:hypothetical protein